MKQKFNGKLSGLVLLGALGVLTTGAHAQSDIRPPIFPPRPWPHPVPWPWPQPILNQELQLVSQTAHVVIKGSMAQTHLEQTFQNVTGRTIEGTYIFPLPEGAAVSGFAMMINGKRTEAEILEGAKARQIYTGIVQKLRDPAILEFIDRNLIRARIFPIAASAEQEVELDYSESLRAESGSFRYVMPLRLPTGGAARNAAVDIQIQAPGGIRAVYSPTHNIEIKRTGNAADENAHITGQFTATGAQPGAGGSDTATPSQRGGSDRDFVLYYTVNKSRVGVNLVTYQPPAEDGYFMLLAAPDAAIKPQEIAAKDVVFVLDTSGSMEGEKIAQARRALLNLLGNLNPSDYFNIITFSSDVRTFRDDLNAVNPATIAAARNFIGAIKAVGGTNINDAMQEALKMLRAGSAAAHSRPQQVIFMTDGEPTVGETDVTQILKNTRAANHASNTPTSDTLARLFVFGVGYDVNTRLLDTLAEDNRGSSDYVLPQEDIEQKVGSLYAKMAYPVLANPQLNWGDMKVYDVYPKRLPDLFRGTQTVVFGRYGGSSKAHVELIGTASGHEERIAGQGDLEDAGSRNDTLPRLWAMRKVGYLIDDARRSDYPLADEVKDEIIKLSKRYGIITPYTTGLITEDAPVTSGPIVRQPPYFGRARRPAGQMRGAAGPAGPLAWDNSATLALGAGTSGANAVAVSKATNALREADQVKDTAGTRYIAGKAFLLQDGVWTDTTFDAQQSPKITHIKFASSAYFALLKEATVAKWLSLGQRVLVVLKGKTVQIDE